MDFKNAIINIAAINKWAKKTESTMKAMLTKNGKKNSDIYNKLKIIVTTKENSLTIETNLPDYAIFVDKGRRPGKQPPIKNIIAWCKSKGIPKTAAFPIARKIGERGLKGTNFLSPLRKLETLIADLKKNSENFVVKDINKEIKK